MKVYGSILINNFGEVLLVRGRLSKKWSFPKGHCKRQETDFECAKRELLEETGLSVDAEYSSYHKLKGGSYFVFPVSGRPCAIFTDHKEIELVQWWPLNCLPISDSNVDVSIFRSLMRTIGEGTEIVNYIDSEEAHQKITTITRNISRN
jgi:8-oxo-dGTP pyrophosphatase MutT (NUDIX family)